MYKEGRNVLLALVLEDEFCNKLSGTEPYIFSARVGTKHIVNHYFDSLKNLDKDTIVYAKVKKAFSDDAITPEQMNYLNNLERINSTAGEDGTYGKIVDYFAYVKNTSDKTYPTNRDYDGTRLELGKCFSAKENCNSLKSGVNDLLNPIIDRIDRFDYSELNKFQLLANPTTNDVLNVKANMKLLSEKLKLLKAKSNDCNNLKIDEIKQINNDIQNLLEPNPQGYTTLVKIVADTTLKSLATGSRLLMIAEAASASSMAVTASVSLMFAPSAYITIGLTPVNLARSIDSLIVNQASVTLGLSHEKKCEFADQNLLDQQRQQVRNFIRGLKEKLKTIVQNISESRYSNVQQDTDNLTANINDSISVNGNDKGFFPQTNQNINDVCNEIKCGPEDFAPQPGSQTGRYINEKTIKCRICARPTNEQNTIKANLDFVNSLRLETDRTSRLNENSNKERVFGYIRVYDSANPNILIETIKGINGPTTPSGFAPVPTEPRRYSSLIIPSDQGQPDPANDTEVRMLEELAKKFYAHTGKYKKVTSIEIEEFTDRKPCRSCSNILDKVESLTPEIKVRRPYKLGIYESGEWIPTPRKSVYYSSISCNN